MTALTKGKRQGVLRTHNWEEGINFPTISKTVMNFHEMGTISKGKGQKRENSSVSHRNKGNFKASGIF